MSVDHLSALIGLALAALAQVAAVIIWGAVLTQRVRQAERELERMASLPERFARLETRIEGGRGL
jgi:hypothetical protein